MGDAGAVIVFEDVELVEQQRRAVLFDRELQRAELRIANRSAVGFGDAAGEGGVVELLLPVGNPDAGQESIEVLLAIEMREGVAKYRVEDAVERGRIGTGCIAISNGHAKPAGGGQSGEWSARTLNSRPIWSRPVRRSSAASMSAARGGLARHSACARAS